MYLILPKLWLLCISISSEVESVLYIFPYASNCDVQGENWSCCYTSCWVYLKEVGCLHTNLPFQQFNDKITIMK